MISFACIGLQAQEYQSKKTGYGKWSISWFADEFGDPMFDKPYLQTELKDKSSNAEYPWFYYIRYARINGQGFFETNICTQFRNLELYGDYATVKIKNAAGRITTIHPPISKDGSIIYVGQDAATFASAINQGNFKISITAKSTFHDWDEPDQWTFPCTNETKDFIKAKPLVKNITN